MEAYFDNSATTKVFDCVKDIVIKTMTEDYGNAASKHLKGVEAERYIREAKSVIAKSLKAQEKEIVFTSGGSESNNMALIGGAMAATSSAPMWNIRRFTIRWAFWKSRDLRSPTCRWIKRGISAFYSYRTVCARTRSWCR